MTETDDYSGEVPVELIIDGILDLHSFSPKDLKNLVPDYIDECLKLGIMEVKIIHGKGTGTLRRTVHSILERIPTVSYYKTDDTRSGNWGATIAFLSYSQVV